MSFMVPPAPRSRSSPSCEMVLFDGSTRNVPKGESATMRTFRTMSPLGVNEQLKVFSPGVASWKSLASHSISTVTSASSLSSTTEGHLPQSPTQLPQYSPPTSSQKSSPQNIWMRTALVALVTTVPSAVMAFAQQNTVSPFSHPAVLQENSLELDQSWSVPLSVSLNRYWWVTASPSMSVDDTFR